MTQQEALEILLYHQRWRLGADIPMKYEPLEITAALDVAIEALKQAVSVKDVMEIQLGNKTLFVDTEAYRKELEWVCQKKGGHEYEAVCDNGNGTTLSEYKARCHKCGHMP